MTGSCLRAVEPATGSRWSTSGESPRRRRRKSSFRQMSIPKSRRHDPEASASKGEGLQPSPFEAVKFLVSKLALVVGHAAQVLFVRIRTTGLVAEGRARRAGIRNRPRPQEQHVQDTDGVRKLHGAIVVRVSGIHAVNAP